jgi:hypothetical protein
VTNRIVPNSIRNPDNKGEKLMSLKKGTLKSFDDVAYTATIQLSGSNSMYLEGIAVARNLPIDKMVTGRKVAVAFFTESNPKDAVVVAVYV